MIVDFHSARSYGLMKRWRRDGEGCVARGLIGVFLHFI